MDAGALRAGKAVLCEKPLALTVAEVDETAVAAGFTFDHRVGRGYRLELGRDGGALHDVACYAVSARLRAVGTRVPGEVVARSEPGPTGVDLDTGALLSWTCGAEAAVHVGMTGGERQ